MGTLIRITAAMIITLVMWSCNSTQTATSTADATAAGKLRITTKTLAKAEAGVPYLQQILAQGGKRPYACSISQGLLPTGIVLQAINIQLAGGGWNSYCLLTGTTAQTGGFKFTLTVKDSSGGKDQAEVMMR